MIAAGGGRNAPLFQATSRQAAVNAAGNEYAQLAVLLANAAASALRRADTRSWVTLPDGQQVWECGEMTPGDYEIGISANGRTTAVPVALRAGDVKLVLASECGAGLSVATMSLK